jgi:hypothetical protein
MYKSKKKMLDYAWQEFEKKCNLKKSSKNKKITLFSLEYSIFLGEDLLTHAFSHSCLPISHFCSQVMHFCKSPWVILIDKYFKLL